MAQNHCHADSCFEKKVPPIDITRKCEKLCTVAFKRKFDYDDVIKMKNKCHISCRATTYQNLGENPSTISEIISIELRKKLRHQNFFFFIV